MYDNPFIYKRPLQPKQDDLITIDRHMLLTKALAGLKFGHWYLVSGGKKIGKTSFLLTLMHECRRRNLGYRFAAMKAEELEQFHIAELFSVLCRRIEEQIPELTMKTKPAASLQDFKETLLAAAEVLPAEEKAMIILDSVDTLPKNLLQEFFRGLLHIHQLQTTNRLLAKFQFAICGTLNTSDMQFEQGHSLGEYAMRVMLEDFRLEDVGIMTRRVAQKLGLVYEQGFSRTLHAAANGTGYLIQKICYRLLERAFVRNEAPAFSLKQADTAIESIVKEGDTNIEMVLTQIEKDSQLVESLMQVLRVGSVGSGKFDPNLKTLVAYGALTEQNGFYRVRNRIYENAFKDRFTTERLADLYFSQHKYDRARDLISQAATEQIDAKNALQALLGNIQGLGASLEHCNAVRDIIEAFMNVVDSTKNCSLMLLHPATQQLRIADAIGLTAEEIQTFELPLGAGVAGWVAQAGRYRVVRDVSDEIECPDYVNRELAVKQNLGAMACFPLKAGDVVLGVINLCLVKPRLFSASEVKMLEALAGFAALVLQNSRLYESRMRYFDRLAQVRALVREANHHTEIDSLAPKFLAVARAITETDKAYLVYRKPVPDTWGVQTLPDEMLHTMPDFAKGEGLVGYVLQTGNDYFSDTLEKDEHYFPVWKNMRWEWALPCMLDDEPQGCLVVAGENTLQLTPEHQHLMAMLADAVAITLRNKRIFGIADKKTQQVITAHVLGEALSRENSLQEVLKLIATECLNIVGRANKVAFVWLKDSERDKLIIKATDGSDFGREKLGATLNLKQRSLAVAALNSRTFHLARDVAQCKEYRATHPDIRSEFAVPLIFRDEVLGVIDVQSFVLNDFDEHDIEAVMAISHHAAVAIKIVEWSDVERKALQALNAFGNKVSSSLNVKKVLRIICDEGLKLVGDENCNFILQMLDPETQAPTFQQMRGVNAGMNRMRRAQLSLRESWVIKNKTHYLCPDTGLDTLYTPTSPQINSAVFVPVIFDDQVLGVITMESLLPDHFGENELWLIRTLANQAGVALTNALLGETLTQTQVDLESAAIEEIIAGLSHDIKNYSSLIAGETQWLVKLEREHQLQFEEVKKAIANIDGYIRSIEGITGSFKNRAYRLPPQLSQCKLRELVDEAIQMVAASALRQEVEIQKDEASFDVTLSADRGRLVRAFFNLMTNALDAMPNGGTLRISGECEDANVRIFISDSGAGIPEALHNKVMQAGFSTKERGYGLGLALTKRIVETDHHGKMVLHSEVAQGTTIEINLPRQPELHTAAASLPAAQKLRPRLPRLKSAYAKSGMILVVNDDAAMLKKVGRLLRSAGHRVVEVDSGKEAVLRCRNTAFDVIVLDYHLRKDEMDSQTAISFVPDLKKHAPLTPIILTSASLEQLGAPEMFCDFFLEIRPSFWQEILDFVNRCLALKASMHGSAKPERLTALQKRSVS